MIQKMMAATENLQYEDLYSIFVFSVVSVAIITAAAFILPLFVAKKR